MTGNKGKPAFQTRIVTTQSKGGPASPSGPTTVPGKIQEKRDIAQDRRPAEFPVRNDVGRSQTVRDSLPAPDPKKK